MDLPDEAAHGTFVAPAIIEISHIADVEREVFGPVLHVLRYRRERLGALIDAINATGYGLTFGLHTRLEQTITEVADRVEAGNIYVNRNVIGAVVGVQPFGGRGLSGTGPKAGGPLYLGRMVAMPPLFAERTARPPALIDDLARWLDDHGDAEAAAIVRRYGDASALGVEEELPGPVGETNLYALHPRGVVLMRPATRTGFINQLAAVLATGNLGRLEGMALPPSLPPAIACRLGGGADTPIAAALIEGDDAVVLAAVREMAERKGAIVPVHRAGPDGRYELDWLLEERSTSINTTAAGGNASLMMIG